MPMKTPQAIPPGITLVCGWLKKGTIQFIFEDEEGTPRIEDMGALDILPPLAGTNFFEAENIQAKHGWGPFLMDVAMEWAKANGGWLYPHHMSILPEAKEMWLVYFDPAERPDVERRSMTKEESDVLGVKHQENELALWCLYRKTQPAFIDAMKAAGQWVDRLAVVPA